MSSSSAEIYAGLGEVFQEVFRPGYAAPHPAMTSDEVPGWDSLGHVTLIVAIEDRFSIKFTNEEMVGFDSVGELVQMIETKLS